MNITRTIKRIKMTVEVVDIESHEFKKHTISLYGNVEESLRNKILSDEITKLNPHYVYLKTLETVEQDIFVSMKVENFIAFADDIEVKKTYF